MSYSNHVMINRDFNSFTGTDLVVGCGWDTNGKDNSYGSKYMCHIHHGNPDGDNQIDSIVKRRDYLISIDSEESPDLEADMSKPSNWLLFPDQRFRVICFDWKIGILDNAKVIDEIVRVCMPGGSIVTGFLEDRLLVSKGFVRVTDPQLINDLRHQHQMPQNFSVSQIYRKF